MIIGAGRSQQRRQFEFDMKRRDVIALLGVTAIAWPRAARAQQPERMRRIGLLLGVAENDPQGQAGLAVFTNALQELGWTGGRNVQIDYRWAAADVDRMQAFAKELVDLQPSLIVGQTTQVVAALQRETRTIPIVFVLVSDPVGSGFVASLPRPGGNTTGFVNIESSLGGKWIELLKELVPRLARASLIFNPDTATYSAYYLPPFETAARTYGIEPVAAPVRNDADIERVIAELGNARNGGLVAMPDSFTGTRHNLELIISLAARYRVPTVYPYRFMVDAGGNSSWWSTSRPPRRSGSTCRQRCSRSPTRSSSKEAFSSSAWKAGWHTRSRLGQARLRPATRTPSDDTAT
jgi:putative ABC transport system substrate-binding protein